MTEKIIIAGAGGQGIMLLGKVLAEAALRSGCKVTWYPCYGAEVRGGAAYCMVIISSEDIPSPYINIADTLIIMSQPAYLKFKQRANDKGLLLINSSLVKGAARKSKRTTPKAVRVPFTDNAVELGNIKVANMVALGSYIAGKGIFRKQDIFAVLEGIAPSEKQGLVEINKRALEKGMELVR